MDTESKIIARTHSVKHRDPVLDVIRGGNGVGYPCPLSVLDRFILTNV